MNAESPNSHFNGSIMATPPDRAANGCFAPGWRGGPGRPRRSTEADYLIALREAVPLQAWTRIVRKAVDDALAGDGQARTFLAHYLIGRPTQSVGLSDSNHDELSVEDILMTVVDVLKAEPNGIEIKVKLADALDRLEEARGLRGPVRHESN
jgi:hypothetical protein